MAELKAVAINVTVLLMFLNGAPNLLIASGVAEDLGIDPSVQGGEDIAAANDAMSNIQASGGLGQTLFQLYTSVTGPVQSVLGILFGGWIMLSSIGIPSWLTTFLFVPQYLIMGGTTIYVLAGRVL